MKKYFKKLLKPFYNNIKQIGFKLLDFYDSIKGKNPLIPPRSMIFIGDGDYEKIGNEFFNYFKLLGELKPNDKILDVGCGIGRMSVPLTNYLNEKGEYHGFDIVKKGIEWCQNNISTKYANFHFSHADIYNKMYNENGKEYSFNFKFKYQDNYFDFIFLTSVFTHMYARDVENYLKEISRVLKVGGRCLITFFLLNEESNKMIENGLSTQNLIYRLDNYSFTKEKGVPENAIGFNEEYIMELYIKNSLNIEKEILYGSWCGRKEFMSYQDIIIAKKTI